jgi:hypothetical protein
MKKSEGIPVVFRTLKGGGVIALLPMSKEPLGKCRAIRPIVTVEYKEESVDYKGIVGHSRPARPTEIGELLLYLQKNMLVSIRRKWTKRETKRESSFNSGDLMNAMCGMNRI